MSEITFLNGLSPEEVKNRRSIRFFNLKPEEKMKSFFALMELSKITAGKTNRPKAKLTLRKKNGYS